MIVDGRRFATAGALEQFVREMMAVYRDGERLTDGDATFIRELLAAHPEAEHKVGVGVAGFSVATDAMTRRTRHFVLHRTDGSNTDFSYRKCIYGATERRQVLSALRVAVVDQVLAFRRTAFGPSQAITCPVHGDLVPRNGGHVDHVPPDTFVALVARWMASAGGRVDLALAPNQDGQVGTRLHDSATIASWQAYHAAHARLRITCAKANLSLRGPRMVVPLTVTGDVEGV